MSTTIESAIERLELLLQEKEGEIRRLRRQEEERDDADAWSWTRHKLHSADPSPTLLVPRLEIRYRALDAEGYNVEALYSLVYRHLTASTGGLRCDGSGDAVVFVPMGRTVIVGGSGRSPSKEAGLWRGRMYGPFREGAHIRHDMQQLRLPGFIIATDEETYQIDLEAEAKLREEARS